MVDRAGSKSMSSDMKFERLCKHVVTTQSAVKRHFPKISLAAIKSAIDSAEANHLGEIRFVIEAALPPKQILRNMTPRQRALDVFSELRVWDTELNSGVLIYVLFADRAVEIIADRGINAKTEHCQIWQQIVVAMQQAFSTGHFESGALTAIAEIAAELIKYFPVVDTNPNELPNEISFI